MVQQYQTLEAPIRDFRPLRVIVVGAGLSGIHLAARFREFGHNIALQIYERNEVLGGTWYNNVYPGVACDAPSHAYTLTWAPWADWRQFQAPGEDCLNYAKFVAKKSHVEDYTRFNTNVLSAIWKEDEGMWELTLEDTKTQKKFNDRANILVNASGVLSQVKYPDIPGINDFDGRVLHSAKWDKQAPIDGKRVALVGAGSSSIQMLPELQERSAHVDQYIRSTTWIVPPMIHESRIKYFGLSMEETFMGLDPDKLNPTYTDEDRKKFKDDKMYHLDHKKDIVTNLNYMFSQGFTIRDSEVQKQAFDFFTELARAQFTKKPELLKYFTPSWGIGCRRVTPGIGYVQAVQADNVDVVNASAVAVDKTGITGSDGKHREYDIIVFATGFNTSFATPFEVHGRNNAKLHTQDFANDPKAYMTAHMANMPNYFTIGGPFLMSFNGDFLGGLEKIGDYVMKFIIKFQRDRYKSVCVKTDVVEDFTKWADTYLERTVHTDGCSSWYKQGDPNGKVRAIWPGSTIHMFEALADPCWEEFDWERYPSEQGGGPSRFHYLGNGRTTRELNGGDLAYYIKPIPADDKEVPAFDIKDPYPGLPPI